MLTLQCWIGVFSCWYDQMPDKGNLREGGSWGSLFKGIQSSVVKKKKKKRHGDRWLCRPGSKFKHPYIQWLGGKEENPDFSSWLSPFPPFIHFQTTVHGRMSPASRVDLSFCWSSPEDTQTHPRVCLIKAIAGSQLKQVDHHKQQWPCFVVDIMGTNLKLVPSLSFVQATILCEPLFFPWDSSN